MHEASLYDANCVLTLTYNRQNLPPGLRPRDVVLFLKRLRKSVGPVRYFQCGEYGEQFSRPHHHMLVFGWRPRDLIPLESRILEPGKRSNLFRSDQVDELWGLGDAMVGDVTFESAAYVCRYVVKKQAGPRAEAWYQGRHPEYTTMSRKPGIGREWFKKFAGDVFPEGAVTLRGGFKQKVPRYYEQLYESLGQVNGKGRKARRAELEQLKEERVAKAEASPDNTPGRLAVRMEVQRLNNQRKKREYETC